MTWTITIAAQKLDFPAKCACCLAATDGSLKCSASVSKGKRVVRTTTKSWDVPYCRRCLAHRRQHVGAGNWFLAAFGVGGGVALGGVLIDEGPLLLLVGLAIATLAAARGFALRNAARAGMSRDCAVPGSAAAYLGWHGSEQSFAFARQDYVDAFRDLNGRKRQSAVGRGGRIRG